MNRRETLIAMTGVLASAVPMMAAGSTSAYATAADAPITVAYYRRKMLEYGHLSVLTSRIAYARSTTPLVQDFARGEILEQKAAGQAITSSLNPPAEPLTPAQQAALAKVENATPDELDVVYLTGQLAAHKDLLALQDDFQATFPGAGGDLQHISLIAKAFILNHIEALVLLKSAYGTP